MSRLFKAAERFVIIYSSDKEERERTSPHVRHRKFTSWIKEKLPDWSLMQFIPNSYPFQGNVEKGSFADFFIYIKNLEKRSGEARFIS